MTTLERVTRAKLAKYKCFKQQIQSSFEETSDRNDHQMPVFVLCDFHVLNEMEDYFIISLQPKLPQVLSGRSSSSIQLY